MVDINLIKIKLSYKNYRKIAYEDIADPETGEVLVEKDNMITEDVAIAIQDTGINVVNVNVNVNGKKLLL